MSTATAAAGLAFARPAFAGARRQSVKPVPARHVTLKPSIFADAQAANRAWLASLSPDRLLHNFHKAANLPPRGDIYGGWEAQSIAGHSLGTISAVARFWSPTPTILSCAGASPTRSLR
ncbi:beta-L-arabinofuranosidase domain-containing protein [Brevundimonas sp.]|uniref:beta-L-arabinofuranosidase domain-containing protein n=1 Tax=Brevundimonas sp. TaxID=1871086 RepID=UPI002737CF29|nr:beta-L-arabinofuranosidase domain-containing protein [Brevundimonas sp.]